MRKCTHKEDRRAAAVTTHRDKEMFRKATTQHRAKTVSGRRVANTAKAMDTIRAPCKISIPIGKRRIPKCSIGNLVIIMSKGRWSASQPAPIIMTQSMIISRRITTHTPTTRTRCRWWRDLPSTSTLMGANRCRVSATAISRATAPCMAATPSLRSTRPRRPRKAGTGAAATAPVVTSSQKASDTRITNNFDD